MYENESSQVGIKVIDRFKQDGQVLTINNITRTKRKEKLKLFFKSILL